MGLPHSSQSGFFFLSLSCSFFLSIFFFFLFLFSFRFLSQRCFAAYRNTSLRSCFQKKGFCTLLFLFLFLFLIIFQKKVPATNGDFDFFFQKSACYQCGFCFFFSPKIPPILKLEVGFSST